MAAPPRQTDRHDVHAAGAADLYLDVNCMRRASVVLRAEKMLVIASRRNTREILCLQCSIAAADVSRKRTFCRRRRTERERERERETEVARRRRVGSALGRRR